MTGIVKGTYILNLYVDSGEAWIAVDEAELLSVGIDYQKDLSAASKFRNEIIFLSVPKDSDVFFEALLSKNTCKTRCLHAVNTVKSMDLRHFSAKPQKIFLKN